MRDALDFSPFASVHLGRTCPECGEPVWLAPYESFAWEVCDHNHFTRIKSLPVFLTYVWRENAAMRLLVLWQVLDRMEWKRRGVLR